MCLNDEMLRAHLDGELSPAESIPVKNHLVACAACRERAESMARQAEDVHGILSTLLPPPAEVVADASIALARFKFLHPSFEGEAPSVFSRFFARRLRPIWGALAIVCLGVALVSIAPARTWAQKLLAMLRVQKITVVPVDFKALGGPSGDTAAGKMLGQMLSDNVVVTLHSEPQAAANAAEASQRAGFNVRLLSDRADAPQITLEGEQAFHLTVDRDRVQAILNEAGRSDLILPASLDGATVAVHIPSAVVAKYGHCPSAVHHKGEDVPPAADIPSASDCVIVAQVPSPTVSVPPDLNIAQLVEVGLQAGGMTAEQAHAFSQTVDWTSTLVLPLPRFVNSYQTVSVDGVEGTLIDLPRLGKARPAGYTLVWVKSGVIYSLMGFGDSAEAVPLAETLD